MKPDALQLARGVFLASDLFKLLLCLIANDLNHWELHLIALFYP